MNNPAAASRPDVVVKAVPDVRDLLRPMPAHLDELVEEPDVWLANAPIIGDCQHVNGHIQLPQELPRADGLIPCFRGHFATRSRRYSITLGAIRAERHAYRLALEAPPDATTYVVATWKFLGLGHLTDGDQALAMSAAARAREQHLSRCSPLYPSGYRPPRLTSKWPSGNPETPTRRSKPLRTDCCSVRSGTYRARDRLRAFVESQDAL